MADNDNTDLTLGRRLVALSDDQLATVLEFAASVPWQTRKLFLLAVANALFHCNCCDDGPNDAEVLAACQRAMTAEAAA